METQALHIIKSTETIPVEHPVFLIFGQPGIGKTSLGYSARNPLLLDFDQGSHRAINRLDTLQIDDWSGVAGLMEQAEALAAYDTIVVDTVGRCLDMLTADIAITDPKKAPGGNLTLQGWGTLKNRFRTWMSNLRLLGKDVLLLAHDKEDKDGDTRIVRPDIAGGSFGEAMKIADFIGYLYMNGKDRVLDFNPTDRWTGKNPAQWAPLRVPAPEKAAAFLADLAIKGRECLCGLSNVSASVASQVNDWRAHIQTFVTAEDFNRPIPEIKKLSGPVQPQVVKLLMDAALGKQIPFDKVARRFVSSISTEPRPESQESVL